MKNKKITYLLLGVVLLIWGGIIVEITNAFSKEEAVETAQVQISSKKIKSLEREKFTISEVNRDPFLGTFTHKKTAPVKSKSKKKKIKKPIVRWSRIAYKGSVSDQKTTAAVYLIEINGNLQFFNLGKTVNEITLLNADAKKILLKYKGEKKEFAISK